MAEIIVVEDDPSISNILMMLLQLNGHSIRTAANGLEGLHLLREKNPDIIISDI
jgi:DNA-binding response OmpR family regulator